MSTDEKKPVPLRWYVEGEGGPISCEALPLGRFCETTKDFIVYMKKVAELLHTSPHFGPVVVCGVKDYQVHQFPPGDSNQLGKFAKKQLQVGYSAIGIAMHVSKPGYLDVYVVTSLGIVEAERGIYEQEALTWLPIHRVKDPATGIGKIQKER